MSQCRVCEGHAQLKTVVALVESDVAEGAGNTTRPLTRPSDWTEGGLAVDSTREHEEWRPIAGFEGYLEVSNQGRVRSLDRTTQIVAGNRVYLRTHRGRVLKQAHHRDGYRYITLAGGGRLRANAKVHHLVLEAFRGPRPDGADGCHANDIPHDNRLSNLRWDSHSANHADRVRRKTHCVNGHELSGENVYTLTTRPSERRCRECSRASNARARQQGGK